MKKWNYNYDMARHITEVDKLNNLQRDSGYKEINISEASHIAKKITMLYKQGGKQTVMLSLIINLDSNLLSSNQKSRVESIVKDMFFWHWFPLSRIRCNMRRIISNK